MTYVMRSRYPPDVAPIVAVIRGWAWMWAAVAAVVWAMVEGLLAWRRRD
jgi:hypothetical protein